MQAWKRLRKVAVIAASTVWLLTAVHNVTTVTQVDVKGSRDHPLIERFSGSWLVGYKTNAWEQAQFPTSLAVKDGKWVEPVTVEGRLTKAIYVAPAG